MLDSLKKKKMLESLGVNHTLNKKGPNNVDQKKDVVQSAADNMQKLSISAPNTAKLNNQSMQKNPMRPDLENKPKDLSKTIDFQKTHQTLGVEDDGSKKKKMLESLFRGKK